MLDSEHDIELKQAPKRVFEKVNSKIKSEYVYKRELQLERVLKFYGGNSTKWSGKMKRLVNRLRSDILIDNSFR
ncbi:hypothetical protein LCGC14_1858970 [marine sediment metagenome]|uniref:Uncharacterized protein n=1 Tax=marine sediment metagenome TaxID=412755 RepID=A0A0F9IMG8_9ZZZZ